MSEEFRAALLREAAIQAAENPSKDVRHFARSVADYLATPAAQPEGPTPAGWRPTHKHLKRGTLYAEVARGFLQCVQPPADMSELVAYRDQEGRLWFRPPSEFDDDERFALVPPTAAAPNPAAPAAPADGFIAVHVKGLGPLLDALDHAKSHGYLFDAIGDKLAAFELAPDVAAAPSQEAPNA